MNMPGWVQRASTAVRLQATMFQQRVADAIIDEDVSQRRTWWGRLLRYWLGPAFFWTDTVDERHRPSHSKLLSSIAFFAGLWWCGRLMDGIVTVWLLQGKVPPAWLFAFVLAFSSLVFALPYGLNGFKAWLVTRGGGTVQAFARTVEAASPAAEAPGKAFEEDDPVPGGVGA